MPTLETLKAEQAQTDATPADFSTGAFGSGSADNLRRARDLAQKLGRTEGDVRETLLAQMDAGTVETAIGDVASPSLERRQEAREILREAPEATTEAVKGDKQDVDLTTAVAPAVAPITLAPPVSETPSAMSFEQQRDSVAEEKEELDTAKAVIARESGRTLEEVETLVLGKSKDDIVGAANKLNLETPEGYREGMEAIGLQPDPDKERQLKEARADKIRLAETAAVVAVAGTSGMFLLPPLAPSPTGGRGRLKNAALADAPKPSVLSVYEPPAA